MLPHPPHQRTYKALKTTLKSEIDEALWETIL